MFSWANALFGHLFVVVVLKELSLPSNFGLGLRKFHQRMQALTYMQYKHAN